VLQNFFGQGKGTVLTVPKACREASGFSR